VSIGSVSDRGSPNLPARSFVCSFAAGRDSLAFSGIWRVWAARNKPALFLAVEAVGEIKATVHCPDDDKPTWKRHYGFWYDAKGEVADAVRAEGGSRHQATWNGAPVGKGRTIEWRIFVLETALRKTPLQVTNKAKLVPPPGQKQCLVFAVILGPASADSDYPHASDAATHLLAAGSLCDGRRVWITYCYTAAMEIPAPSNPNPRIFGSREAMRSAPSELRVSLVADNSDGSLVFWDCRVENKLSTLS
jgi:hypothetical protein